MNRIDNIFFTINKIERKFGKGSIIQFGSNFNLNNTNVIKTGSIFLNISLGIGGYPFGRIIEIYGPEASGKTTLGLHTIAELQKTKKYAAFIDVEHSLDVNYAKNIGIILGNLLLSQPNDGEQALEIINLLSKSNIIKLIILDSVAALVPKSEIIGTFNDIQIGIQARLMSRALRKLAIVISKNATTVIFINQIRIKVGLIFGNPEVTTGGKALKFYSSIRIDIKRLSNIKRGNNIIGNRVRVKIVKNKLSSPFKEIELDILYGLGISREGEILDLGIKSGIIKQNGAWLYLINIPIGQGREHFRQKIKKNSSIANYIKIKVFKTIYYKIEKYTRHKI